MLILRPIHLCAFSNGSCSLFILLSDHPARRLGYGSWQFLRPSPLQHVSLAYPWGSLSTAASTAAALSAAPATRIPFSPTQGPGCLRILISFNCPSRQSGCDGLLCLALCGKAAAAWMVVIIAPMVSPIFGSVVPTTAIPGLFDVVFGVSAAVVIITITSCAPC